MAKKKTQQPISLLLPIELEIELNSYCAENAANRSAVIRKAIEQFLKEKK